MNAAEQAEEFAIAIWHKLQSWKVIHFSHLPQWLQGGFQLLVLIITNLKSHMTCKLKIQGLSLVEIFFVKKYPLQDLLSSLNAVKSTNERH